MQKIVMSKKTNLTIGEAFDYFIRKCKVKNLTEQSIHSYQEKLKHFFKFLDKNEPITNVTSEVIDDYILYYETKPSE